MRISLDIIIVMRPLRDISPDKLHLVSCRTLRSELLLVPLPELNQILGGVIAKYLSIHTIELFAICILGNHYHLLLRAPTAKLPIFAENINREIALRVNRYLGREGHFWGRRYDDLVVIEETDALEGLLYILTNPVKHGLVRHTKSWPGICSYWQSLGAKDKSFTFCNYTEYNRAKRRARTTGEYIRKSDFEERYTLEISPISKLKSLSNHGAKKLEQLLEKRISKLVRERISEGKGFLGRKAILEQSVQGVFPSETNKTNRPICYTKNLEAAKQYRKEEKQRRAAYNDASYKFRLRNFTVIFPAYCILPPLHHYPKLQPT